MDGRRTMEVHKMSSSNDAQTMGDGGSTIASSPSHSNGQVDRNPYGSMVKMNGSLSEHQNVNMSNMSTPVSTPNAGQSNILASNTAGQATPLPNSNLALVNSTNSRSSAMPQSTPGTHPIFGPPGMMSTSRQLSDSTRESVSSPHRHDAPFNSASPAGLDFRAMSGLFANHPDQEARLNSGMSSRGPASLSGLGFMNMNSVTGEVSDQTNKATGDGHAGKDASQHQGMLSMSSEVTPSSQSNGDMNFVISDGFDISELFKDPVSNFNLSCKLAAPL